MFVSIQHRILSQKGTEPRDFSLDCSIPHWSGQGPVHWPLPAVRDLIRDSRLSTYDESVIKLSKVSLWGKCARTGHLLKLPSPTKLARLSHFPPAKALPAGCSTISFLWFNHRPFCRWFRWHLRLWGTKVHVFLKERKNKNKNIGSKSYKGCKKIKKNKLLAALWLGQEKCMHVMFL
jgi:hypothetical protein